MIPRLLAVNALEEELDSVASFCRTEGIGMEVTAFAFPTALDDGYDNRVRVHAQSVDGIEPVAFHGPFLDLYATSMDPAIVAVCRDRHQQAIEAAAEIGASIYVAHLNFLPLIKNRRYRDRFVDAAVDFWIPFADKAASHGITIVLENLWEPDPTVQKQVVESADHKALKASFDNGHALVFSEHSAAEWIRVLGDDLLHCHLHDNHGKADDHYPVGNGVEDWSALFAALNEFAHDALVVLESDKLDLNRKSLAAVRELLGSSAT